MNRRAPVLVILLGVILAALVIDRTSDDDPADSPVDPVPDASVFPIMAEPGALSSTWFCAGGTADEEAFADHVIVVANPTAEPVTVTLTVFSGVVAPPLDTVEEEDLDEPESDTTEATGTTTDDGSTEGDDAPQEAASAEPVEEEIEVPARSRQQVALRDLVDSAVASALVESSAGGIAVEHEVSSIHGYDAKPCVTSASSTWHFAWGDTTVDARELLVLFNPFPEDAIVDGRFSTEDGAREPERFDGLVVPGRGTLAVDLGDDVTRRQEVAATITARNGRIIVDRVLRIDGDGRRGLTVQSGTPEPQLTWVYPDGFVSEAVGEEFAVYNPGDELAEVEIEFVVDDPEEHGIPEPVNLSLVPGSHQIVDMRADGRIPDFVGHTSIVRSVNDVPIVAERAQFSDGRVRRGVSVTTGSPVEAEQWTFAAGNTQSMDEWLVLANLDAQILSVVDVVAVIGGQEVPVSGLQEVELGAGERRVIDVGELIDNRPDLVLVVTSTEPIVAERNLYALSEDERGISSAVGIPSPAGVRLPPDPLAAQVDADLGEGTDGEGDEPPEGDAPTAPDDVDLPSPDETIVIDDPDAEAEDRETTSTTSSSSSSTTTTTAADG